MARETGVQSQVESYQRLKKCYLIPPCLTLSIIRYVSRVKWSNPGEGVAPSPTPQCSSYWKRGLRVTLDYSRQLYFAYLESEERRPLLCLSKATSRLDRGTRLSINIKRHSICFQILLTGVREITSKMKH